MKKGEYEDFLRVRRGVGNDEKMAIKIFFKQILSFLFGGLKKRLYLCIAFSENGRLAQLVQSICLTSRGSAVRIRQRPLLNKSFSKKATQTRAFSSAGSEHLPYKQRVGGSNPSTPTTTKAIFIAKVAVLVFYA